MPRILIVDDEESIRSALRQVFEYEDHEVATAEDGPEALELYESFHPHVTFLDVKMSGLDGLEVLSRMRKLDGHACVVMISGHGTIDTAVEATQKGAFDFIEKPLDTGRLLVTLRNVLELRGLTESVQFLRSQVGGRTRSLVRPRPSATFWSASIGLRQRTLACSSPAKTEREKSWSRVLSIILHPGATDPSSRSIAPRSPPN